MQWWRPACWVREPNLAPPAPLTHPIINHGVQELAEAQKGGVCEGRKQRRGNQPLLCRKVDLEEVVFSVRLVFGFV